MKMILLHSPGLSQGLENSRAEETDARYRQCSRLLWWRSRVKGVEGSRQLDVFGKLRCGSVQVITFQEVSLIIIYFSELRHGRDRKCLLMENLGHW